MIWFTSDTHFGHTNIAGPSVSNWKEGYRNFNSVHEMNKELMYQINRNVKEDDILYHLGDFSFSGGNPKTYRDQIICKQIHIILGNHDKKKAIEKASFSSVSNYLEINHNKIKLCLFHYSMRVWNKCHRGSIHLYGHSHNSIKEHGKSMDVGVDSIYSIKGEYRPISIEEIFKYMKNKDTRIVDHHV